MSVLKCPDCGNQISDKAPHCPHCGRPILGHLHEIFFEFADKAQSQGDAEQADKWVSSAIAVAPDDYTIPDRWRDRVARIQMALYHEEGEQIRKEDEAVRRERTAKEHSEEHNRENANLYKQHEVPSERAKQKGELGDFYDKLLSETGDGFVAPSRQGTSGEARTVISPSGGTVVSGNNGIELQTNHAISSKGHTVAELGDDSQGSLSVDMQGFGTEALSEVKRKKKIKALVGIIAAVLLMVCIVFTWNHFQSKQQATSSDSITSMGTLQASHQVLIGSALAPDWIPGSYEGDFSGENDAFTINLSINTDGTIFQHVTSQGKVENISGTVSSYDKEKGLGVQLDGMENNIFYPVDTLNHRLSVGDGIWLNRKK